MQKNSKGKIVAYFWNKMFKSIKCVLLMHLNITNKNDFTKIFNIKHCDFKWIRSSSNSWIIPAILKNL